MLFSSYTFLLAFLPVALLGYVVLTKIGSRRTALTWVVVCSLFYYGWWKPVYLLLLGFSVFFNFILGVPLSRAEKTGRGKLLLAAGVAVNLGLLGYFKYAGFLVSTAAYLAGAGWEMHDILLPIGISFFTFQQIAYLVDTYRGETHEYHFVDYALFVTFFPQLIAGPIVHHKEVLPQFATRYRLASRDLAVGLVIFVFGLGKKVLLADEVAVFATPVFQAADAGLSVSLAEAWTGTLAYALQLYFDFSGYSDMAIGIGRMFGIKLPLNFDSPYKATSIVDFWRRWHMTLSRFLRDYLYIPLGGNRKGGWRRYGNLMTTMVLGGLWHGAGWNFALWGFLHGFYLCVNHVWSRLRTALGWSPAASTRGGRVVAAVLTFLAVLVAWVPFRAETFTGTGEILRALVGLSPGEVEPAVDLVEALPWILSLLGAVWLFPNTQEQLAAEEPALDARPARAWSAVRFRWAPSWYWSVAVAVIAYICLLQLSNVSEFLYYQF